MRLREQDLLPVWRPDGIGNSTLAGVVGDVSEVLAVWVDRVDLAVAPVIDFDNELVAVGCPIGVAGTNAPGRNLLLLSSFRAHREQSRSVVFFVYVAGEHEPISVRGEPGRGVILRLFGKRAHAPGVATVASHYVDLLPRRPRAVPAPVRRSEPKAIFLSVGDQPAASLKPEW